MLRRDEHACCEEAGSPQAVGAIRVDHAGGRFCRTPMRGAGYLHLGREDFGRRRREPAGHVAAGVLARRPHRAQMPGGVAPRPLRRSQIPALVSTHFPRYKDGMRSFAIIVAMLCASSALADSTRPLKLDTPATAAGPVPLKGKASSNSCAAYGPGFVKVEGTN